MGGGDHEEKASYVNVTTRQYIVDDELYNKRYLEQASTT